MKFILSLVGFCVIGSSCVANGVSFTFNDAFSKQSYTVYAKEKGNLPLVQENISYDIASIQKIESTSDLYVLEQAVHIAVGQAFSIELFTNASYFTFLWYYDMQAEPKRIELVLPNQSENMHLQHVIFRIPVSTTTKFTGMQIQTDGQYATNIMSMGIDKPVQFYDNTVSPIIINPYSKYRWEQKEENETFVLEQNLLLPLYKAQTHIQYQYMIEYNYFPNKIRYNAIIETKKIPHATILFGDVEGQHSIQLKLRVGKNTVFLYSNELQFIPHNIRIITNETQFTTVKITARKLSTKPMVHMDALYQSNAQEQRALLPIALPIDLGSLYRYPRTAWRLADFEIFSWTAYPNIYFFDFRTLSIQARFFKRLAFFIEKKEFRGKLLTNTQLANRHGWNAHDYQAYDLARFFSLADKMQFKLNKEEELLRVFLEKHGLIIPLSDGSYSANTGVVLGITQATLMSVRRQFINHEAIHAVFFSDESYRAQVIQYWNNLSEQEQEFWQFFLTYMGYDVTDDYLMVNEYQAYILQQLYSSTNWYFTIKQMQRLEQIYPYRVQKHRMLLRQYPRTFKDAALTLNTIFLEHIGLLGGDLFEVE